MREKVLELINVSKLYKLGDHTIKALDKASLAIRDGEFVSIIGPSGSGKSTLMHLMGLLDTPTSGSVFLDGEDISSLSEEELARIRNKKIGFVFQQYNLLPRTTALDNVGLPLLYTSGVSKAEIEKRAKEALMLVGLSDRMYHFSSQLSGGQQQRVAIARSLVNNPTLILADEPTGNLDTKTGDEIMKIFEKLNKQGKTIVLVTHEQDIAKKAKRIIKMRDGKVLSEKLKRQKSKVKSAS
ncbi:MAG: ABC transporter ATP-binding protein [Candidatus Levybacteria bacterium]|nr:ABC transporter ATP-binding protein [Candidatus Levybacteria bacterium]